MVNFLLSDSGEVFSVSSAPAESVPAVTGADYSGTLQNINDQLFALSDKADFFVGVMQVVIVFSVCALCYKLFRVFF